MRLALALALATASLVLTACDEDSSGPPPEPPVTPGPQYNLATAEGAGEALRTLFRWRDGEVVASLLRPDAVFTFEPFERAAMDWPVEELSAGELRQALANLLSGNPVDIPPGGIQSGVDSVTVGRWNLEIPFHDAPAGSPFPGTLEGGYRVRLTFYADGDSIWAATRGGLTVNVLAQASGDTTIYRIAGLQDRTGEEAVDQEDAPSLGRVLVAYLANRPPTLELTVAPASGPAGSVFTFDAGASVDPEGGDLHYRWRLGAASQPFTPWSARAVLDTTLTQIGTVDVTVVARDRWEFEVPAFATVTVTGAR